MYYPKCSENSMLAQLRAHCFSLRVQGMSDTWVCHIIISRDFLKNGTKQTKIWGKIPYTFSVHSLLCVICSTCHKVTQVSRVFPVLLVHITWRSHFHTGLWLPLCSLFFILVSLQLPVCSWVSVSVWVCDVCMCVRMGDTVFVAHK